MLRFPLIRTKWSNEHVMAALFVVLVLYHIPQWIVNPVGIVHFLLLIATGAFLDAIFSMIRYKRIWCCVSGVVTAAILSVMTGYVPLWGRIIGVVVALVLGKYIFGGTGKNIVNPAVTGLLFIILVFEVSFPIFESSYLLIPAILLSLPFLRIRPYAGIGYMLGMVAALLINNSLSMNHLISYGVIFFSCILLTDPVSVTKHPTIGAFLGLAAGFAALFFSKVPTVALCGILAVNLISYGVETFMIKEKNKALRNTLRIPKVVVGTERISCLDLTGEVMNNDFTDTKSGKEKEKNIKDSVCTGYSSELILSRIKANEVYGMGGAAFSTYQKIISVIQSKTNEKYMIINGVECDPGLVHDFYLLRHHNKEIIQGIDFILSCIPFMTVHLAVKDVGNLEYPEYVQIHKIPDFYPAGAERFLIQEVLSQNIAYNQKPAESGILVLNAQTILSVYEAVALNKKIQTRFLTVANLKEASAKVVKVKLGMKVHKVIEEVFPGSVNVFVGGGLMQSYLADEDTLIGKDVNFIATGEFPNYKESPQCLRCGNCSKNCPAGLKVDKIADLVDRRKMEAKNARKLQVMKCISCGSCSYSCLAGRNLSSKVVAAKEAIQV
ncbi:RnfABCDGE type electron transport complex subunit D [Mobilitalea sibirica]|uniref:RnfABCDGE type electron transport complex subunit D n=1 Tax=Mobilitalea sibirica TaxID=1462919 RepID=A0A8J7HDJ2_9FIRM|nr:RnfABCDGE type electron transport complex subunit D [Mobilitalea sibirica]MBH1940834.1 RnfABCDGE type electron transport complex subunit D [Mobilitalea sibirica]